MLVVVMVCVAVLSMLTITLVRSVIHSDRQLKLEERTVQADWLAQGGLDRAAARLTTSPDYQGEIWEIAEGEGGLDGAARIEITIAPLADLPEQREATVFVTFPANTEQTNRRSRTARLPATASTVESKD
ncbi:MAG: hypothetical protein NT069_16910 [Planctomycetota bacterium]|nr:hypothetical protein [Planctomycetota bacterium]